jgi:hypothetical protein
MANHGGVDESEVQAAISAIKDRKHLDISEVELSQRVQLLRLRRKLGERLQPVFVEAGLDIEKINSILADHQNEVRMALEKEKLKSAEIMEQLSKSLQDRIANQKRALEYRASIHHPITTQIFLFTPFSIAAHPAAMLVDAHTEAFRNWAKISYNNTQNPVGPTRVSFYFAWTNESQYLAVLDADSWLVAQGFCSAYANYGLFGGGSSSITLYAKLYAYIAGQSTLQDQLQVSNTLSIDKSGINYGGGTDLVKENISGIYRLSIPNILVPSGRAVVFEVALEVQYAIDDGGISLSFNDNSPFGYIECPFLDAELLTPPAGTVI